MKNHIGSNGKSFQDKNGELFDWERVFLSPSILYSGAYCKQPNILLGKTHMVALQTRVTPNAIVKSSETLRKTVLDDNIPAEELEWVVKDGSDAVLYGLLVRRLQTKVPIREEPVSQARP